MNKIFKKFLVVILALTIVFTSSFITIEKNNAAGLTLGTIVLGVAFLGSVYFACDYVSNPDKYSELKDSMKDFCNASAENQKKIYELEKANFKMVMDKAVDAGVGTCLIGPNGVHITAKQLQQQEYLEFDTWKGYKEKESQKPSGSAWKKFELGVELADMLITLFQDKGHLKDDGTSEQLYYTGDDGYMDEDGNFTIRFKCRNVHYVDAGDTYTQRNDNSIVAYDNYSLTARGTFPTTKYRIWGIVSPGYENYYNEYNDKGKYSVLFRGYGQVGITYYSGSGSYQSFFRSPGISKEYKYEHHIYNKSTHEYETGNNTYMYTSFQLLDGEPNVYLYDYLSTNIPVFDSFDHGQAYYSTGSLEGLINGAPQQGPTPTEAPAPPPTVSPVRQYVNYFSGTFSPSVMPYYVNYNIVNNWDGNDTTFNINDYTGVLVPTLTPAPDADGKDTNVTNNILIVQTNILTEINETVTNIYNFFQIDVDYITEELQVDSDENPTGFDNLKKLISEFESAFPADKFDAVTQELDLLYPKITIKVPKALDRFLKVGDDKIILEDGVKKIVLCDFNDYAIYFVRFRKFLEIVLRIGLIFYLLKELTVVFTVA